MDEHVFMRVRFGILLGTHSNCWIYSRNVNADRRHRVSTSWNPLIR